MFTTMKWQKQLVVGVWGALLLMVLLCGCLSMRPSGGMRSASRKMVVTGYCACGTCCNWRRNTAGVPVIASGAKQGQRKAVGMTASGARARVGTIAADPDIFPFGTIMYVEGYGYGRVEDTGSDIKGYHIDLFFRSHAEAKQWGRRRTQVVVWAPSDMARERS
jgi:3D (Asp-Asp-Asp) domain-containing protein